MTSKFKTTTMIAILAIIVATTTTATNVKASSSIDQGYNAGRNDRLDDKSYNDYCDPINGDAKCAVYKASYRAGWAAASLLHGDDEPRNDQDFNDRTQNNDDNDNNEDDGEFQDTPKRTIGGDD